jgi:hypothetical protein
VTEFQTGRVVYVRGCVTEFQAGHVVSVRGCVTEFQAGRVVSVRDFAIGIKAFCGQRGVPCFLAS